MNVGAGQGPRNTAHSAKLKPMQIDSKTQASQLKMCIRTYRRYWRIRVPLQESWLHPQLLATMLRCGHTLAQHVYPLRTEIKTDGSP